MPNKIIVTSANGLQAALNAAALNTTSIISIDLPNNTPTIIEITTPIVLPNTLGNSAQKLIIEGNGVTFSPVGNSFTGAMIIKNQNPNIACSFVIKDIHFNGNNNSCTGLELCNASDVIIENCKFSNSSFGLTLRNVNNAAINNCQAVNISAQGYTLDVIPTITQSSIASSGCGNVTFNQCRFNTGSPQASTATAFFMYGANRTVMNECSSQGLVNHHIRFNSGGSFSPSLPPINNFNVTNFTFNGTNSNTASIYLTLTEGFAKLSGLYTNDQGVIVYAQDTPGTQTLPHLYIENVPYLDSLAKFQTAGGVSLNGCPLPTAVRSVVWSFNEVYRKPPETTIFGATRWVGGLVPYYRYEEFFAESKKIITNSITINGNPV